MRNELRRGVKVIESGETVDGAASFARGQVATVPSDPSTPRENAPLSLRRHHPDRTPDRIPIA